MSVLDECWKPSFARYLIPKRRTSDGYPLTCDANVLNSSGKRTLSLPRNHSHTSAPSDWRTMSPTDCLDS